MYNDNTTCQHQYYLDVWNISEAGYNRLVQWMKDSMNISTNVFTGPVYPVFSSWGYDRKNRTCWFGNTSATDNAPTAAIYDSEGDVTDREEDENMEILSTVFPNAYFLLSDFGPERTNIYYTYAHNGEHETIKPHIEKGEKNTLPIGTAIEFEEEYYLEIRNINKNDVSEIWMSTWGAPGYDYDQETKTVTFYKWNDDLSTIDIELLSEEYPEAEFYYTVYGKIRDDLCTWLYQNGMRNYLNYQPYCFVADAPTSQWWNEKNAPIQD